jgi:hypothetical protein
MSSTGGASAGTDRPVPETRCRRPCGRGRACHRPGSSSWGHRRRPTGSQAGTAGRRASRTAGSSAQGGLRGERSEVSALRQRGVFQIHDTARAPPLLQTARRSSARSYCFLARVHRLLCDCLSLPLARTAWRAARPRCPRYGSFPRKRPASALREKRRSTPRVPLRRRPHLQPGRRGQRRGRSRRSRSEARRRRRFSSLASSRSSLSPTSRKIRSTTAPRPRVMSAMASTSPINPPTRVAQIEPATTSAAADPNARMRGRGVTVRTYPFGQLPSDHTRQ